MPRHPLHFAVALLFQPRLQARLLQRKIGIADADLLKAEREAPLFYILSELLQIERV